MSDYFKKFPVMMYNFAVGDESPKNFLVTDILRRVKVSNINIKAYGAFDIYQIQDGDTPEVISDKYYGTSYYHWLILMVNDIVNGIDGFPKTLYDLEQYCIQKYGIDNLYNVHHYEDADGTYVNDIVVGNSLNIFDPVTSTWVLTPISSFNTITNYDYENTVNENKRVIYLLKPSLINAVVAEIDRLMVL